MERIIIFKTIVGSHAWNMQRPESDIDYFVGFAYPTEYILKGYHMRDSYFKHTEKYDEHGHEVEKICSMLLKGNINFIIGVLSPVVIKTSKYHKELKNILYKYPPKNAYHSIRGMAVHHYKKYVISGMDTSERRMNKIARVINFGINLLKYGEYKFEPFYGATPALIKKMINELDEAYEKSKLPEHYPEDLLRNWLFKLRLDFLKK